MNALQHLIQQESSQSLGSTEYVIQDAMLGDLYSQRNGFTAYNGALLVRPYGFGRQVVGIEDWNDSATWLSYYPPVGNARWFATDLFGNQFGTSGGAFVRMDVETGEVVRYAETLESWASRIVENAAVETAYPLAQEWARRCTPLLPGERLVPRHPFVLGGAYSIDNLVARNEVLVMHILGPLAQQLRHLPDGAHVKYSIIP